MKTQQIEITIGTDGQVSIHVLGVDGMQCLALTKELEAGLGGMVVERKLTSEAYPQSQPSARALTRRSDNQEK